MHCNLYRCMSMGCIVWMLILQSFSAFTEEAASETQDEIQMPSSVESGWIHGRFDANVDAIIAGTGEDVNLDQRLNLTITPPTHQNLSIHGSFWAHEDIYSGGAEDGVLYDIYDTWGSSVQTRVYQMYAQWDGIRNNATLRIGRQRIMESAAYNRIDGVYWAQRHNKLRWYVFGGVRATVYNEFNDDPALGGGVSYRPVPGTRVSVDAYYSDESGYNDGIVYSLDDTRISFKIYQQLGQYITLLGRYDLHEGSGDTLRVQTTGFLPQWDLIWEASYRRQFSTVKQRTNDLTAFYRILGTYQEYDNVLFAVHKPITQRLTVSLEAEVQQFDNDGTSQSNRDYERYAGILSVDDILKGIDTSVALEHWHVDQGESVWAITGEVSKTWESLQLTFGVDYSRYEDRLILYDPFWHFLDQFLIEFFPGYYAGDGDAIVAANELYTLETTENIYAVYSKARWSICENQDIRVALTYEEDDSIQSPYWRFQMGYSISF